VNVKNNFNVEKKIDLSPNYVNTFADEIIFQIGEKYSKLIFYNYGKNISEDDHLEQDRTHKTFNVEVKIPNHALKTLSVFSLSLSQIKDSVLSSLQNINPPTAEAYNKLSSKIESQYFDTDQSIKFDNFYRVNSTWSELKIGSRNY
jgi:hypothetical protein